MAYITREDGIHFVIPSYRDVLVAKKNALQKEVNNLSKSYGEYVTMQSKGAQQYEIAFSPDPGYLLGETVWHQFNRPMDMIYCEAIPNTTDAILVIVKGGSVYLDGSFPIDSIPEELVIFLTQQNNFEIYCFGDVPIAEKPTEGKFSFDDASVKSFNILDQSVFKKLPLLKEYHLQLLDVVLKQQGIGTFPVKQVVMVIVAILVGYYLISSIFGGKEEVVEEIEVNPYQAYVDGLASPAPDQSLVSIVNVLKKLYTVPGWKIATIVFQEKNKSVEALMRSSGNDVEAIMKWCKSNNFTFTIKPIGIVVSTSIKQQSREKPKQIYRADEALAVFIDKLAKVYPGNSIALGESKKAGEVNISKVTVGVANVTPMVLILIANQLRGLPFNLKVVTLAMANETLSGSIELDVLGN